MWTGKTYLSVIDPNNMSFSLKTSPLRISTWKTDFFLGPLSCGDYGLLEEMFVKFRTDFRKQRTPDEEFFKRKKELNNFTNTQPFNLSKGKVFCWSQQPMKEKQYEVCWPEDIDEEAHGVTPSMVLPPMSRYVLLQFLPPLLHWAAKEKDPYVHNWVDMLAHWLVYNEDVTVLPMWDNNPYYDVTQTIHSFLIDPVNPKHPHHKFFVNNFISTRQTYIQPIGTHRFQ